MKPLFRFFLLLSIILGGGIILQKPKETQKPMSRVTLPSPTPKSSPPHKKAWDKADLSLRRQMARQAQVPEKYISLADVNFKREYPNFIFVKTPSYSILTEQKSFAFQNAFQTLTAYENQFRQYFSGLIKLRNGGGLQAVFFDSEKTFNAFRAKTGIPSWIMGFYSFQLHRLFIYNAMDITKSISPLGHVKLPFRYQEILVPTLTGQMDQILSIMRHEATHQLCVRYGMIATTAAAWLLEGVAAYCEKPQIGLAHRQYMTLLPHVPRIQPAHLMQMQSFLGLDETQALSAYATSWSFVYYLMQSGRQGGFYQFMRVVQKDPAASMSLPTLARYLRTSPDQLEADFERFLNQLASL